MSARPALGSSTHPWPWPWSLLAIPGSTTVNESHSSRRHLLRGQFHLLNLLLILFSLTMSAFSLTFCFQAFIFPLYPRGSASRRHHCPQLHPTSCLSAPLALPSSAAVRGPWSPWPRLSRSCRCCRSSWEKVSTSCMRACGWQPRPCRSAWLWFDGSFLNAKGRPWPGDDGRITLLAF